MGKRSAGRAAVAHQRNQTRWCSGPLLPAVQRLGAPPALVHRPRVAVRASVAWLSGCVAGQERGQRPNQVLTSVDKTHSGVLRRACRRSVHVHSTVGKEQTWSNSAIKHVEPERVQQLAKRTRIMEKSAGTARLNIWLSYLLCQSVSPVPLARVTPLCRRRTLRCLANNGAAGICRHSARRSKPPHGLCAGWPESKDLRMAPLHTHLHTVGTQPPSRALGACPHSTRPIPLS